MCALPWIIAGILYVLGALNMAIPAHDSPRLRGLRVRYVMALWPGYMIIGIIEAIFQIDIL